MDETVPALYERIMAACEGGFAAIRSTVRLEPVGGPAEKVFPPTYVGGLYATERRWVDGQEVEAVVLDSVQSQANRFEEVLQRARDEGLLDFPLPQVEFDPEELADLRTWLPSMRLTALQAPHRIADPYFNESELEGTRFRDTEQGQELWSSHVGNATPMFLYCPTSLIFGVWDSHGPRGGMGAKFPRALVSEIVGYRSVVGWRTGGRIDPVPVSREVTVFKARDGTGWTTEENEALRKDGKPVRYGKEGKASELGFGNVTPDFARAEGPLEGLQPHDKLPGGVTIDFATQTTVLSLAALRRLRFPLEGRLEKEVEARARAVLASLALAAVTLQRREGYALRSRCDLRPSSGSSPFAFELVPLDGSSPAHLSLDDKRSVDLFRYAVDRARDAGLRWPPSLRMKPTRAVVRMIKRSIETLTGGTAAG